MENGEWKMDAVSNQFSIQMNFIFKARDLRVKHAPSPLDSLN